MLRPRVLLGDDHHLVIEGLKSVLERHFDIVGIASNGRDLIAEAKRLSPDVILLDVSMPILNGIEAARQLKEQVPSSKLVFVTQKSDREYVQAALRLGASGYVLKQCAVSELVDAVNLVLAGKYYVTPLLRTGIPEALFHPRSNPSELFGQALTGRQREVLQLIAEGKSNKQIANIIGVSVKTVDFHKSRLADELGLRTTAELTRYALEHGIVCG
jgi:DNA-binding NarL/FixJ family response regulator